MKLPELVEDAKQCWTWLSMQAMTAAGALQVTWLSVPEDMKAQVPNNLVYYATLALIGLGVIGRLVKQNATKS